MKAETDLENNHNTSESGASDLKQLENRCRDKIERLPADSRTKAGALLPCVPGRAEWQCDGSGDDRHAATRRQQVTPGSLQ